LLFVAIPAAASSSPENNAVAKNAPEANMNKIINPNAIFRIALSPILQ
jgi:hypothetical protein